MCSFTKGSFTSFEKDIVMPYLEMLYENIFPGTEITDSILKDDPYLIIMFYETQPVGLGILEWNNDNKMNYLHSFGIIKEYRRQGLGKQFWKEIVKLCEGKFIWEVYSNNDIARIFYLEVGGKILYEKNGIVRMIYGSV